MRRLFFLGDGSFLYNRKGLFGYQAVYQQADAGKDEGDAKYLPHIKEHVLLKLNLGLLDELDQEPYSKEHDEENPYHLAPEELVHPILV